MYLGGLCFITNSKKTKSSLDEIVFKALNAGVKWIQYREKEKSSREIYEESIKLRELTRHYNAVLIINDYADIAHSVDADGLHIGQDDLHIKEARKKIDKDKIIGISTHNLEQAIEAEKSGANYIGLGPVFYTTTKDVGMPIGIDTLKEVRKHVKIPIVAIGGINLINIKSVLETGVDGVAISSGIMTGDIERNVRDFIDIINRFSYYR